MRHLGATHMVGLLRVAETLTLTKPFSVPVLGAETSAAEDENHWMWSLQFGELSMFRGVIAKFIVGEDCPGNNVRSHIQPFFLLKHDISRNEKLNRGSGFNLAAVRVTRSA